MDLAASHDICTMWVSFDDCAIGYPPRTDPYLGPQDDPKPGEYFPFWTPSPGHSRIDNTAAQRQLDSYVRAVIDRFEDPKVITWDLYDESGITDTDSKGTVT